MEGFNWSSTDVGGPPVEEDPIPPTLSVSNVALMLPSSISEDSCVDLDTLLIVLSILE